MSPEERERRQELLRKESWRLSLAAYAYQCSAERAKWFPYPWLRYVARELERELRKPDARVIVNAPPRHGKSELLSHWLPTWYLDLYPQKRIISTAFGDSLARSFGRKVRDEFQMNEKTMTRVRKDVAATDEWETTEGGGMKSVGVGGPITGKGGDLLLVDDPHKNWEEAQSAEKRKRLIDWFGPTFYTRAEPGAAIIVIQTRWHTADLTGYLMNEHSDTWKLIRLPAIAEHDDPLGRKEGEALEPRRYTAERLQAIKRSIGTHAFAGLHQQRPTDIEGGIIKADWIRHWDPATVPQDSTGEWIFSWDCTFDDTQDGSYVVGQVWRKLGSRRLLIDQFRERVGFVGTLKAFGAMMQKFPHVLPKYVEKKANGAALRNTLRDKVPGIIMVEPQGSKEARLSAVSPLFEAGNVELPPAAMCPWVMNYVHELTTFPNSENDDQVDATSQALDQLSDHKSPGTLSAMDLNVGLRIQGIMNPLMIR